MIRCDAGPIAGAQCSGASRAAMHHGAKNSACRNTPPVKCATLKTSDNASIPAPLARSGVSVISSGGPVIDARPSADLHGGINQWVVAMLVQFWPPENNYES